MVKIAGFFKGLREGFWKGSAVVKEKEVKIAHLEEQLKRQQDQIIKLSIPFEACISQIKSACLILHGK
jgi:hypothetical protein